MPDHTRWNDDRRRHGGEGRSRGYREAGRPSDYGSDDFERGRGFEDRSFEGRDGREPYRPSEAGRPYGGQWGRGQAPGEYASTGHRAQDYGAEDYGAQGYGASQDYGMAAGGSSPSSQGYGASSEARGQGRYEASASQAQGTASGQAWRGGGDTRREPEGRGWMERAGEKMASWFGGEREGGAHRGRGPKNYTRADDRIREDINDSLTEDSWLDAGDVEVEVSACEVTLSGTVRSRDDKRRAEDLAEQVAGVRHVQNNLRVQAGGGEPDPASVGGA